MVAVAKELVNLRKSLGLRCKGRGIVLPSRTPWQVDHLHDTHVTLPFVDERCKSWIVCTVHTVTWIWAEETKNMVMPLAKRHITELVWCIAWSAFSLELVARDANRLEPIYSQKWSRGVRWCTASLDIAERYSATHNIELEVILRLRFCSLSLSSGTRTQRVS